jgi:hypothetical protein
MGGKYKFLYKNAPLIIATIGLSFPIAILYFTEWKITKLDRGVVRDIERIKQKGKNFSDIPKSF